MPKAAGLRPLTEEQKRMAGENYGLAFKAAVEFGRRNKLNNDDESLSAAFEGLVDSTRTFKPEKKIKFSTHAMNAMYWTMRMARDTRGIIPIPHHQKTKPDVDARRTRQIISLDQLEDDEDNTPLPVVMARESSTDETRENLSAKLHEAIDRLPDQIASIIRLQTWGVSQQDIADELGIPYGQVRRRAEKAVQMLREMLAPQAMTG